MTHLTHDIQAQDEAFYAKLKAMLITGVKGEIYPCKPDIFAATYEPES